METYSPGMAIAVRKHFRLCSAEQLASLLTYYLQRQGPGLGLLREEYKDRGLPDPLPVAGPFPPACPRCGQQLNRCICPPFLRETANVATHSHA